MAGTISSVGIGTSGLDVSGIITKLVDLEKAPLTKLTAQSTLITTRISAYSQIKSLSSTLSDAALKLSLSTTWKATTATSSNTAAVSVTTSGTSTPVASSYSVQVQQLALAQSAASASMSASAGVGEGTLRIQLGTWDTSGATPAFSAGSGVEVPVAVTASDTVASIAGKINAANAGVTATVITDANGQRLMVRSNATGEAAGYRIQVDETVPDGDDDAGLSRLAFDPQTGATGMASAANAGSVQYAQNAKATVNNIPVTSTSNVFTDTVPGLKFTAAAQTTTAVTLSVATDNEGMTKAVTDFVSAFNALNTFLGENTKYDSEQKQAALLQGDSSAIGLQNMLRNLIGSPTPGGKYARLSEIGVSFQQDGSLAVDTTKLTAAFANIGDVVNLFTADTGNSSTDGFGRKLKSFMSGVLSTTGTINNRTTALQAESKNNANEQTKVNDRAATVQARLEKQYTALDTKMAQLNALNAYISQQVTTWNKSND